LVEGDGENILLPTIAKLLGRPLEDYGVSIVNVGNLAYKRYAKIYRKKKVGGQSFPMKVACVTDLDIWPDRAEKKPENDIGFKVKKEPNPAEGKKGNLNRWVSYYDDKPDDLATRKANKCEQDGENVKTFVSEEWTFEYCLAKSGLAKELYCSVKGSEVGFEELGDDPEEKAIQVYGMIEKMSSGKTMSTYNLAEILSETYKDDSVGLKNKLPKYIVSAIEYVTESIVIEAAVEQAAHELEAEGAQ
jgi:putative ATP-dependent endonuclease of OLD family